MWLLTSYTRTTTGLTRWSVLGNEGRCHPSSGRVELTVTDQKLYGGSVTITKNAQPLRTFCIYGGAVSDYYIH